VNAGQERFLALLQTLLSSQPDIDTIALGLNVEIDHDPLQSIIRGIESSSGLIAAAFRRTQIAHGDQRIVTPHGIERRPLRDKWLTSSYCHIEVALAFRLGIPLLILQERSVVGEGVLDRASTGKMIELIDVDEWLTSSVLATSPIATRIAEWLETVRAFHATEMDPPDRVSLD
jgi:hypothetical protein